jgi:hypothetical protein
MANNIFSMRCPSCGANLSGPNGAEHFNCLFCGGQLKVVSEGGIKLLEEMAQSVSAVHKTVQRNETTLNDLTQKVTELHSKSFPERDYPALPSSSSSSGFDWLMNLGSIILTCLGVAFIWCISGADWAIFWAPMLFFGRFMHLTGSDRPWLMWSISEKVKLFIFIILIAAAFIHKFG